MRVKENTQNILLYTFKKYIYLICFTTLYSLSFAQPFSYNDWNLDEPDSTASIQDLYKSVQQLYKNSLYTESIDTLNYMLSMHPSLEIEMRLLVLLIDTHLQRGDQGDALKAEAFIQSFKVRFPQSTYFPHVLYYQAILRMNQGSDFEAAQLCIQVINQTTSEPMFQRASAMLSQIIQDDELATLELENVIQSLKFNRELLAKALLRLGDTQVKQKSFKAARHSYETWLAYFSDLPEAGRVKKRIIDISKLADPNQVILVMLPLTGMYQQVGQDVYKGIHLALENTSFFQRRQYRYKVVNTEGNSVQAIRKLRKELKEQNVIGILGPAMSHVSTAVAIEVSNLPKPIPMITPTATTQGIASLGGSIFQTNVTTQHVGKSLAQYSRDCKGLQEYAIMAPNTPYGLELASTFEKQVLSQGGNVLATELYDPTQADHGRHFKVIKSRKARKLIAQDSSLLTKQVPELDPETNEIYYVSKPLNSREQIDVLNAWAQDSTINIDGLLLVAQDVKEANALYSQSLYHKINTTTLGSPDWYDISLIQDQLPRINEIILNTDFLHSDFSKNQDSWKSFEKLFIREWGHTPQRASILGYDATQFFLLGLQKNTSNPLRGLKKINSFSGVRGTITMDISEGINSTSHFVRAGREEFEILHNCLE
jgi:ABC-type branched-subunit amino acid transport system substrate-binding protein